MKTKKITAFILVLCMVFLSGCSLLSSQPGTHLATYLDNPLPSKMIKTENHWISLLQTYGDASYGVSVSDTPEKLQEIHHADDVSIWFFDANDQYAVWCEHSDKAYTYLAYDIGNQKLLTAFQTDTDPGFQPQNIGIWQNKMYYCFIDYEHEESTVCEYDLQTGQTQIIRTMPSDEMQMPSSISVKEGYLSVASAVEVAVIDLETGEEVFVQELPEEITYVYAISYDNINDVCALYYCDTDSEDIGILQKGTSNVASVFTFSKNHYAYRDNIEFHNGHIYWINQANVSGQVADHYRFVDYNYLQHKPTETKTAFAFSRSGDTVYTLRFYHGIACIQLYQQP